MREPTQATKDKAIQALDGMREIVRHEMLTTGTYIEEEISNPRLAKSGAICGGHKHCAIGSLWVGAGIKPVKQDTCNFLPGADEVSRPNFLKHRPGLKLAYNALNEAASDFMENKEIWPGPARTFDAAIERLFEGCWDDGETLTKRDLLGIIAAAKRKVKAA
jgi:hypothetical protein